MKSLFAVKASTAAFISILLSLLLSAQFTQAHTPLAIEDIYVQQDNLTKEYSPFLYQKFMAIYIELPMDDSCSQVAVQNDRDLYCISKMDKLVRVGTLDESFGDKEWRVFSVKWQDNVHVAAIKNKNSVMNALKVTTARQR